LKAQNGVRAMLSRYGRPAFHLPDLLPFSLILIIGLMMANAVEWRASAKAMPLAVGSFGLIILLVSFANQIFSGSKKVADGDGNAQEAQAGQKIHMDIVADTDEIPTRQVIQRALIFLAWLVGFALSMWCIGLLPTIPIFLMGYMRLEGRERWKYVLPQAVGITLFVYFVFDQLLKIPWPPTLIGTIIPALKMIPSV